MSYWHRLSCDGWQCPECGTRQYGEYECESDYCESMRQIDDERDRKRHRDGGAAVKTAEHFHRRPRKPDFEGKTIKRWKFWFTDGTSFAIQSELHYGTPIMDLGEVCIR